MRQLFVHIGTHKTGTTSIQVFLARQAATLARHGISVPPAGCVTPASAGQHNIGWALRKDPRSDARYGTLDDLALELKAITTPSAVISSEDLEYLVDHPELIATFEQKIRAAGWEPHYLLFLRDSARYAISLYHELLKHGDTEDFASFGAEILETGYRRSHGDWVFYFDYAAFVSRWRAATQGRLSIVSYDAASRGAGVVETMLDTIGVPTALAQAGHRATSPWRRLLNAAGLGRPQPALRLNTNAGPTSEEMLALANRIGAAYPLPHHLFGTSSAT